jgi:hypothetical protein
MRLPPVVQGRQGKNGPASAGGAALQKNSITKARKHEKGAFFFRPFEENWRKLVSVHFSGAAMARKNELTPFFAASERRKVVSCA